MPDQELRLGESVTVNAVSHFSDPDGDALTYAAASSDSAVAAASVSGSVVTVRALARGVATVTVTATDPDGLAASQGFGVTVPNSGPAVEGALADIELPLNEETSVDVASHFTDPDGDALAYAAAVSDSAVASAEVSGSVVTVRALARGAATVTVTATDPDGTAASLAFEVTVPNSGPAVEGALADIEVLLNEEVSVDVASGFTDPDGDALAYSAAVSADSAVAVAVLGGVVTVRALARGAATVTVTATDPDGLTASLAFEVTVPNSGPTAEGAPIPDIDVTLNETASVDASAYFTDPDGDALAFAASASDSAVASVEVARSVVTVRALARGAATVTVTASDPDGLAASLAFGVTVPNSAPAAEGTLAGIEVPLNEEATVDVASRFADPDGDALAFAVASSDTAVAAAAVDGSVVTVRALARGVATVTVTASDPDGLTASLAFEVTVPNSAPAAEGTLADMEILLHGVATVDVVSHFTDADGDALAYAAASSDSAVAMASVSGSAVTVRALARGAATVTVTASDPAGLSASLAFAVTVPNSGPAAEGTLADVEILLNGEASVEVAPHFTDADGDALAYAAASSDTAVAMASVSGSAVTVRALARGAATVTVTAADPAGLSASLAFAVTVPNSGPAAEGTLADIEVILGEAASVDVASAFTDPDGDTLAYAAASSDPAVAETEVAGSVVTVRALARGAATVTVTASDPAGLTASLAFAVTVPNSGPATGTLADIDVILDEEASVDLASAFTDPDGDALAYQASSSDASVAYAEAIDSVVTVYGLSRGAATVTVTASDPAGLTASLDFEVTVTGRPPQATGSLSDVELGFDGESSVDVSSNFSDSDGDALSYDASSSAPAVAAASMSGSVLTVRAVAEGSATITVSATDADGLSASLRFGVTVGNRSPASTGSLADVELGIGGESSVDVASNFSDPDGDPLGYAASSSAPAVASASAVGSEVTVSALAEGSATVTVTATDPDGLQASLSFDVSVGNLSPRTSGSMPNRSVVVGASTSVDAAGYFTDPDGDALSFSASSSNTGLVTAATAGSTVTATGVAEGTATVTVTATDPGGLSASQSFSVAVGPASTPGFDVTVRFSSNFPSSARAVVNAAVDTWESILADSDLTDISYGSPATCRGSRWGDPVYVVDELLLFVEATAIDGSDNILAQAGPCAIRSASYLPVTARIQFDSADLPGMTNNELTVVALHEIAHALGFGTLWGTFGLLQNRYPGSGTHDTYFSGSAAIAAFNDAGGSGYTGEKVPVQNTSPGANGHWRRSIFTTEIMGPRLVVGGALSAITAHALADLGYSVDTSHTDPYTISLPGAPIADDLPTIDLHDDILRIPLRVVDENGRVLRVIPPPTPPR